MVTNTEHAFTQFTITVTYITAYESHMSAVQFLTKFRHIEGVQKFKNELRPIVQLLVSSQEIANAFPDHSKHLLLTNLYLFIFTTIYNLSFLIFMNQLRNLFASCCYCFCGHHFIFIFSNCLAHFSWKSIL